MKIIFPNIIATHLFVKELQKGVYVHNKKNDKLGRSGLPYGKIGLQNAIKDLDEDIAHIELKITETEALQEGWKEALKVEEEGSERYKEIEEEINNADISISNYKLDIEEKKNLQKEYKEQLQNLKKKKNKEPQEKEYLTKRELENKYGGRFGRNEYPRTFTAAEQNQNRDLD